MALEKIMELHEVLFFAFVMNYAKESLWFCQMSWMSYIVYCGNLLCDACILW